MHLFGGNKATKGEKKLLAREMCKRQQQSPSMLRVYVPNYFLFRHVTLRTEL